MGMTRSKNTVKICMKQLNENEKVRDYLENNVYDKLQFCGKSHFSFLHVDIIHFTIKDI